VVLEREYDPWGVPMQGGSASGYAFTGREWDPEFGKYYYRARYYSPDSGRFIASDPAGFSAGVNFFSYVGARPTAFADPSGLNPLVGIWEGAAIGGAIGNVPGAIIGGIVGALIGAWIAEKIIDVVGDPPYPIGPPNTTVRGDSQSRRYGPNGHPKTDTDTGHHIERFGPKHAHDWSEQEDGKPPRNEDRSPPRHWKPGDPEPPRSCPK
jgi:RHS repeat-associated protein